MDTTALRKKAHHLKPMVRIGKAGVTSTIVDEIKHQLRSHKMVKIRMLRAFHELFDTRKAAEELAEKSKSSLLQQTGNTVVLYRD